MSLLNKASLIQIPSGYKDTKLYSAKPTNGDGDFTFSRGSNLAATRVNSEGLIEKGRENLLTYSNTFSNSDWTKYGGVTLTSGQADKDGGTDAWLLTKPAASFTGIGEAQTITGVITFSVFAKANTHSKVTIRLIGTPDVNVVFNLSDGTIFGGTSLGWIDRKIESVGNGWYKCSLTLNNSGATNAVIYPDEITNTTAGSIYIQDAQVELGLVATDYIETTTTTAQAGILEDMPRLDYSGGASCPSLLLEPQRSNVVTQSEYFGGYTNFGSADTANQETSPEGVVNATLIEGDGSQSQIYTATPIITVPSAGDYTLSIFAKKGTEQYIRLFLDGFTGSSNNSAYFDLDNGTTPTSGASIEDYDNEWYRCSITATIDAGDLTGRLAFNVTPSTSTVFYGSAGAADGKNLYVYGLQLEAGSYPTSYIPTYGSSVTRSADDCTIANVSSLLGSATGTAYVDLVVDGADTNGNIFLTIGTNTQNLIYLWILTSRTVTYEAYESGGLVSNISTSSGFYNYGDRIKVAVVWADNDFAMYINGSLIGTDTSGNAPTPTKLWLGQYTGGNYKGANINQAILFPTRISNDELADLTTL